MIHFHNLDKISSHNHYLTTILGNKKFFFVGGMIRDLLLDRATNMDDVDITAGGTHEVLKTLIHNNTKKEFSFFDTEKYGTMTIIPKNQADTNIQYEITPFRTETTYSDGRHPDDVVRSDSLLEDSKRRDFTINCIYYTNIGKNNTTQKTEGKTIDDISLIKSLERNGWYYDTNSYTLILQNHDLIHTAQDNYQETTNTLGIDNVVHLILDPHHGIQDLINKKIRAVGIPDRRFQEDALRVIRALRFSIALECDIEKHTRTSLQKNAYLIRQIAKERIKQECDKVFSGNNPFGFISLLDSANLLKWIFPKVYDNKGVNQPIRYHPFDVYTHTLMVLYHTQILTTDKIVRYAALYHDVGKVEQYNTYNMKLDDQGIRDVFGGWLNHPVCGADFVKEDFKKLGASNDEIEKISRYVRRHMKPGEILMGDKDHYKKKLRPLIAEVGSEMVKNVCLLTIGDRLGQYNPIQAPQIDEVYHLISLVDEIMSEEGRFTIKKLAIDGNVIIEELNIKPGPQIGKLLNQAYERVLEDLERNNKKILLDTIKQWIIQG